MSCGENCTIKEMLGDASYSAVPHIVEIHRKSGLVNWNPYAIAACIESARTAGNPIIPDWLEKDYFRSIQELSQVGIPEISRASDPEEVRAILSIMAIAKGLRTHGRVLLKYSEEELADGEPDF